MVPILRKYAARARRKLTGKERQEGRRLRQKVVKVRGEIRARGTPNEKRLGLPPVIHGTIEWLLVYAIRGQNEGINGILKKRGSLIGDGQHTSWIVGDAVVEGRVRANCVGICAVALVNFVVTGCEAGYMRAIHNWTGKRNSFLVIFMMIYCRLNPLWN